MAETILVIDDSPEVLAVVTARLRPEGYRVLTAADWQVGMELAASDQPDVILLDVNMPDQSGLDVCRRLKADPLTSAIPVIFLTASDDVAVKVHGFDLGAADYVTKPFHPAELRARVRVAIRTKHVHDDLDELARLDGLTGLRNRRQFDQLLAAEIPKALHAQRSLSLVLVDLDHFKNLNDQFGHAFGDAVLRAVGGILAKGVRAGDYACRYGGEELAVILPGAPASAAADVAGRLRAAIAALSFQPKGMPVTVTASFGVAEVSDVLLNVGSAAPMALVEAADEALYAAKRDGRNRVVTFPFSAGAPAPDAQRRAS